MPLYDYQCNTCEKTFEVLLSSSDKEPGRCQFCNSEDIRKLLSKTSFRTGLGGGLSSLGSSSGCGPGGGGFS